MKVNHPTSILRNCGGPNQHVQYLGELSGVDSDLSMIEEFANAIIDLKNIRQKSEKSTCVEIASVKLPRILVFGLIVPRFTRKSFQVGSSYKAGAIAVELSIS
jgi:hypothetical protein